MCMYLCVYIRELINDNDDIIIIDLRSNIIIIIIIVRCGLVNRVIESRANPTDWLILYERYSHAIKTVLFSVFMRRRKASPTS